MDVLKGTQNIPMQYILHWKFFWFWSIVTGYIHPLFKWDLCSDLVMTKSGLPKACTRSASTTPCLLRECRLQNNAFGCFQHKCICHLLSLIYYIVQIITYHACDLSRILGRFSIRTCHSNEQKSYLYIRANGLKILIITCKRDWTMPFICL